MREEREGSLERRRRDDTNEDTGRGKLKEIRPKNSKRSLVKTAFLLLGLSAAYSSLYQIDQTEQAVLTQFGKPVRVVLNCVNPKDTEELKRRYQQEGVAVDEGAGLKLKFPFIQSVNRFDRRLLRWNGYPEEVPTKDKKYIWVDPTARWYIRDPLKFLRTGGTENQAHARLDDIIDSYTRNSITKRDLIEVVRVDDRPMHVTEEELRESLNVGHVTEGRIKIIQEITDASREMCEEYGIGIHPQGVLIKGLTYVESVKRAVEERMKAERVRIAERYTSEGEGEYQRIMGGKERDVNQIKSEAYMIARGIEGEADAEAVRTYAEGYSRDPNLYNFMRSLELYKSSLEGAKLIMGTDNPLFGLMKGDTKK